MAGQLWLLRHAEAEPHGTRADTERRLTERGRRQARIAGLALAQMDAAFDLVLFSPKVRARQTAELAAEAWDAAQSERMAEHAPLGGGFDAALARAALAGVRAEGRVLLIGHEPDLSQLIADLAGGRINMKKGGVAALRLEGAGGELMLVLRPRELSLIADVVRPLGVPAGRQ